MYAFFWPRKNIPKNLYYYLKIIILLICYIIDDFKLSFTKQKKIVEIETIEEIHISI